MGRGFVSGLGSNRDLHKAESDPPVNAARRSEEPPRRPRLILICRKDLPRVQPRSLGSAESDLVRSLLASGELFLAQTLPLSPPE